MTTTYVLDTSVLLSAGRKTFYSFGHNNLVIPLVVLRELEAKRNDPELGFAARSVLRALDKFRLEGDLKTGISIGDSYGTIRVEVNHIGDVPDLLKTYTENKKEYPNDTRIITVAYGLDQSLEYKPVVLVTKDLPLKLIASLVGVKTEDFTPQNITGEYIDDTEEFEVSGEDIDKLHKDGSVKLTLDVPRNAGVILRDEANPKHTALAIAKPDWSFEKVKEHRIYGLESRSAEQAIAINYLMDESVKIVSLGGRAGTGKTTLALASGLEQVEKGIYKKVVVFRSMHAVGGEELGFLPGTEAEKLDPWTAAIWDSLESLPTMSKDRIQKLKSKQAIEVLPLTHIRGRNFTNCFILIDESQNLERNTILTALSRLGKNSKAVMSWDVAQRDNFRVGRHDGVYEVVNRLLGEKLFAHVSLKKSERSDVAELVSRKLDDFEV